MESKIYHFTEKMSELLAMEREAELEESANLLSRFSMKVTNLTLNTHVICILGIRKPQSSNNQIVHQRDINRHLWENSFAFRKSKKATKQRFDRRR